MGSGKHLEHNLFVDLNNSINIIIEKEGGDISKEDALMVGAYVAARHITEEMLDNLIRDEISIFELESKIYKYIDNFYKTAFSGFYTPHDFGFIKHQSSVVVNNKDLIDDFFREKGLPVF